MQSRTSPTPQPDTLREHSRLRHSVSDKSVPPACLNAYEAVQGYRCRAPYRRSPHKAPTRCCIQLQPWLFAPRFVVCMHPTPRSRRFAAQAQTAMKRAFGRHKAEMWMYRTDRFLESDLSGARQYTLKFWLSRDIMRVKACKISVRVAESAERRRASEPRALSSRIPMTVRHTSSPSLLRLYNPLQVMSALKPAGMMNHEERVR